MALLHMDNFSIYGDDQNLMLNGIYASIGGTDLAVDPDGVSPGRVLLMAGLYNYGLVRFVLPTLLTTVGAGLRIWFTDLPSAALNYANNPIVVYDNALTPIASINIDNTGRINVRNNIDNTGAILGSTTNPVVSANGWYHIEAKFVQGGTGASSIEVRVEGISVLTVSATTLGNNNSFASVGIRSQASPSYTSNWYVKDFFIWSSLGSYNNNFLSTVQIYNLTPTADVSLNWTPSTGTNGYSILDNIPPVDSVFISAANPPPSPYVGDLSNLPTNVSSVKALQTFVRAAKIDGGDGTLQVSLISSPASSPATANGTDRPITVAQTYWCDVFETDPKTSAPWLPSAVNVAQIKINRTT